MINLPSKKTRHQLLKAWAFLEYINKSKPLQLPTKSLQLTSKPLHLRTKSLHLITKFLQFFTKFKKKSLFKKLSLNIQKNKRNFAKILF